MLSAVSSAALAGIEGQPVRVEVHVSSGFPGFSIVGLPDAACRESFERVRAAFLSSDFRWPVRRTTINLAPTSVRKGGAALDLPIAIGLLVAADELEPELVRDTAFLGELGLDGSIRSVRGILSLVDAIDEPNIVVPPHNVAEANLLEDCHVRTARNLAELIGCLRGLIPWPDVDTETTGNVIELQHPDFSDVRGHTFPRWAMEIAAAGGHHVMLVGSPGSGKSMLARRLPSILPDLTRDAALETTRIHSAAGILNSSQSFVTTPPFRAPHHTASPVAVLGGGPQMARPGDISLANNGVLLLDEFPEFASSVIEAMRQPLEEGVIRIARSQGTVVFPSKFQLVATMNPCPCGEGLLSGKCICAEGNRARYLRRLSGPILDRIDMRIFVDRPEAQSLLFGDGSEDSAAIKERVIAARKFALARGVRCNAELPSSMLDEFAPIDDSARQLLLRKLEREELSARGMVRIRKVARTIADLSDEGEVVSSNSLAVALSLRPEAHELQVA